MAIEDMGGIPFGSHPVRHDEGQCGPAIVGRGRLPLLTTYGISVHRFEDIRGT
jgi:hypothetical protein